MSWSRTIASCRRRQIRRCASLVRGLQNQVTLTLTARTSPVASLLVLAAALGCSTRMLPGDVQGAAGTGAGAGGIDGMSGSAGASPSGGSTGAAGPGGSSGFSGAGGSGGSSPSGAAVNHRPAAETCSGPGLDGAVVTVDGGSAGDGGANLSCTQDSDCIGCSNGHLGRCEGPFATCVCDQCATDQDCGATGVCACNGQTFGWSHSFRGNVCVASNCRVDADCGPAGFCSPTTDLGCGDFYGVAGFYCHTANDQCSNDSDCATGTCRFSPEAGFWVCAAGRCAG